MRKQTHFKKHLFILALILFVGYGYLTDRKIDDIYHPSNRQPEVTTEVSPPAPETAPTAATLPSESEPATPPAEPERIPFSLSDVPPYSGSPYVVINNNSPQFASSDYQKECYEHYSELDELGRCGVTIAQVGIETMPMEERESISEVRPSGWQSVRYPFVDQEYLYNRCHLIGFQLTGENANERNLITGTRYMNVEGMLPFENDIASYVRKTKNHVLFRVTPIYDGDNLVASGVLMEAESIEDFGLGVRFSVYCYNVQPGVEIDYATGASRILALPPAS